MVQRGFEKFFAVDETESTKYDTVVAHGDTSPGSFPVRVERKENGIDLTYERQAFQGTRHRHDQGRRDPDPDRSRF